MVVRGAMCGRSAARFEKWIQWLDNYGRRDRVRQGRGRRGALVPQLMAEQSDPALVARRAEQARMESQVIMAVSPDGLVKEKLGSLTVSSVRVNPHNPRTIRNRQQQMESCSYPQKGKLQIHNKTIFRLFFRSCLALADWANSQDAGLESGHVHQ